MRGTRSPMRWSRRPPINSLMGRRSRWGSWPSAPWRRGWAPRRRGTRRRVASLLERLALPVRLSHDVSIERVLEAMRRDKKNRMTRIQFALPSTIGCMDDSGGWTRAAEEPAIEAALKAIS